MTRLLILGSAGMLGHKLFQRSRDRLDVVGTIRQWRPLWGDLGILDRELLRTLDASDFGALEDELKYLRPSWVVNCIGVIKQRREGADEAISDVLNASLPRFLQSKAHSIGFRLIHVSTDCVFSGQGGCYRESDTPDPVDVYGRSKLAGEVADTRCLTLRTSMIGREIATGASILEWFLRSRESVVKGYRNAVFSGLSTIRMAEEIIRIIQQDAPHGGLYHVSSSPIDKFQLLQLFRDCFSADTTVVPDEQLVVNRSLDSSLYRRMTGFKPPGWREMICEIAADPTPYNVIRF